MIIHSDECFTSHMGCYCMEEQTMRSVLELIKNESIQPLSSEKVKERSDEYQKYRIEKGVAIVPIVGSMTKRPSKYSGVSTVDTRRVLRAADKNEDVDKIMLYIDSPGGQAAGTQELAKEVKNLNKPVIAFIDDLGASAAYWVASQADKVYMNETGRVGSIGTRLVLYDTSAKYEKEGVKVIAVDTGEFKTMADGLTITESQVEYLQDLVNTTNSFFLNSVVSGREGMSLDDLTPLANGKIYSAADGMKYGLIDGIATSDEVFAMLLENEQSVKVYNKQYAQANLDLIQ